MRIVGKIIQPSFWKGSYIFQSNHSKIIGIKWLNIWKDEVEISIDNDKYVLKNTSFWKTSYSLIDESGKKVLELKEKFFSPVEILFSNGSDTYFFKTKNFWKGEMAWYSSGDFPVLIYSRNGLSFKNPYSFEVQESRINDEIINFLIPLGWYIIKRKQKRTSAVAQ
ncbi:MAG: hypothetical protein K1X55_03570 [Chitinophagales bacterium]|nr:hypothetical protein [Chitinophagales bacterium]